MPRLLVYQRRFTPGYERWAYTIEDDDRNVIEHSASGPLSRNRQQATSALAQATARGRAAARRVILTRPDVIVETRKRSPLITRDGRVR